MPTYMWMSICMKLYLYLRDLTCICTWYMYIYIFSMIICLFIIVCSYTSLSKPTRSFKPLIPQISRSSTRNVAVTTPNAPNPPDKSGIVSASQPRPLLLQQFEILNTIFTPCSCWYCLSYLSNIIHYFPLFTCGSLPWAFFWNQGTAGWTDDHLSNVAGTL